MLFPVSGLFFACSYYQAWTAGAGIHALFWLGVFSALLPAFSFAWRGVSSSEATVVAALTGGTLYLPKLFHSPVFFNYFDELAHVRATTLLQQGHGAFLLNPVNRVVEWYPGLHALAAGLSATTGLSLFAAGNIIIGCAHTLLLVSVFRLLYVCRLPASTALACTAVYGASPAYVFFDSYFAYESLALPLAVFSVACLLQGARRAGPNRSGYLVLSAVLYAAVILTHHATSYDVAALVAVFSACAFVARRGHGLRIGVVITGTVVAAAASAAWLVFVAPYTTQYLRPATTGAMHDLLALMRGAPHPKQLFFHAAPPTYEVVSGYLSVPILAVAFAIGFAALIRRRDFPRAVAIWFAAMGLLYFASLPVIYLAGAADSVSRIWEVAFIGLAAMCGVAFHSSVRRGRLLACIAVAALPPLIVGQVTARTGPDLAFPGPYAPAADPRSMTPNVIEAARWMLDRYGPGNRVLGDRTAFETFGSYGFQDPGSDQVLGARAWRVFFPKSITAAVRSELKHDHTQFVIVDWRIAHLVPRLGWYFSPNEPGALTRRRPLSHASLEKFPRSPVFRKVYSNGAIEIYSYLGHH